MRRLDLALLGLVLLLAQSCASTTPSTPVTTIDQLVGKWNGTVTIGPRVDFINVTIGPDRALMAIWADITSRGTVSVAGGQATYAMSPPIQEGTLTLYMDKGKGKPELYMESMRGGFYATLTREN